ncbi:MAG: hypothetical protein LBT88_02320 [Oscillospiraceae bacterium]|jgi:hypothetical protein|nr:hypothetical protein [Oscillospiraceae bacterium]
MATEYVMTGQSGQHKVTLGELSARLGQIIVHNTDKSNENSLVPLLFNEIKTNTRSTSFASLVNVDPFDPIGENGEVDHGSIIDGYDKTLETIDWGEDFEITQQLVDDDVTGQMIKLKRLGVENAYTSTRERFAAALYGYGLKGGDGINVNAFRFGKRGQKLIKTTTGDGENVFSAAHPLAVDPNKKQKNLFQLPFSAGNVGIVETAMQNFLADNGDELDISPDTILIPNVSVIKDAAFAQLGVNSPQAGRWNIRGVKQFNKIWNVDESTPLANIPWLMVSSNAIKLYSCAIWSVRQPLDIKYDEYAWRTVFQPRAVCGGVCIVAGNGWQHRSGVNTRRL